MINDHNLNKTSRSGNPQTEQNPASQVPGTETPTVLSALGSPTTSRAEEKRAAPFTESDYRETAQWAVSVVNNAPAAPSLSPDANGKRALLVDMMGNALINSQSRADYLKALQAATGTGEDKSPEWVKKGTFPIDRLLGDGVGSLSDSELLCLAVSDVDLLLTARVVGEAHVSGDLGDCWWDVVCRDGERVYPGAPQLPASELLTRARSATKKA